MAGEQTAFEKNAEAGLDETSPFFGGTENDDLELSADEEAILSATMDPDTAPGGKNADAATDDDDPDDDDLGEDDDGFASPDDDKDEGADDEEGDTDDDPDDDDSGDDADDDSDGADDGDDTADSDDTADDDPDSDGGDATDSGRSAQASEGKGIRVPKWRLDNALKRAQRAEENLAKLREGKTEDADSDGTIDMSALDVKADPALVEKYNEAVLDGKHKDAAEIMSQLLAGPARAVQGLIPQLTKQISKEVRDEMRADTVGVSQDQAFAEAVNDVYETYPFTNPNNKDAYDADFMADARVFQKGFEAEGESPAAAVYLATQKALAIHYPDALKEDSGESDAPAQQQRQQQVRDKKAADTRKRNAKAAKKQPAAAKDDGSKSSRDEERDGELNIDELSDEEFDALPESTRARLRGDY
jgi:hypothetical protein